MKTYKCKKKRQKHLRNRHAGTEMGSKVEIHKVRIYEKETNDKKKKQVRQADRLAE